MIIKRVKDRPRQRSHDLAGWREGIRTGHSSGWKVVRKMGRRERAELSELRFEPELSLQQGACDGNTEMSGILGSG